MKKGREKGRSPVPWGGGSSDPMIDADAPSTEEVVCKLAERARPTGGRHGLTTEAFTLLISIGILLEIPKGPEPCVVGSSDLMREAGAPSTSSRNTPGSGVVPAPPGVVMVAPPEVPRNAEGAQSERPRCLTGARQNNAANNTRIIRPEPESPGRLR